MTASSIRPLGLVFLSLALAACAAPGPADATPAATPLGIDLGPSGPIAAGAREGLPRNPPPSSIQPVHEGQAHVQGTGTVNTVDAPGHKLNLSHQPIPQIGWPAMTMDFAVAPAVNLGAVKPGSRVDFMMEQGPGGMYVIQSITPSAGGAR